MTRITGRNGLVYLGLPERETCLGLKLPPEFVDVGEVSELIVSFIDSLPDASGTFTGYYDKGDDSGADSAGSSGT